MAVAGFGDEARGRSCTGGFAVDKVGAVAVRSDVSWVSSARRRRVATACSFGASSLTSPPLTATDTIGCSIVSCPCSLCAVAEAEFRAPAEAAEAKHRRISVLCRMLCDRNRADVTHLQPTSTRPWTRDSCRVSKSALACRGTTKRRTKQQGSSVDDVPAAPAAEAGPSPFASLTC